MALSDMHTVSLKDALNVIPYYDGNNIPFTHFSRACNEAKGIIPPEAEGNLTKLVRTRILGEPRRSIEYYTFDKMSDLLLYLRKMFGNSKTLWQLQGELGNIYQKQSESVISYATRIKDLGREIKEVYELDNNGYKNSSFEISIEKEMVSCFINGLLPEIERRMKNYDNVDNAIQEAINIANRLTTISVIRRDDEINYSSNQEEYALNIENCQICSKQGHSAITCHLRYRSSIENLGSQSKFSIKICQICNKRNHIASECRFRKQRKTEERSVKHIRENFVRCQMCHGYGHTADKCLQTQKSRTFVSTGHHAYQLCHNYGHTADHCHKSQPLISCQICKKTGHFTEECFQIQSSNSFMQQSTCELCKQPDHTAEMCFNRNLMPVPLSQEVTKCKYCREFGHVIENCTHKEKAVLNKLKEGNNITRQLNSLNENYSSSKEISNESLGKTKEENIVQRGTIISKEYPLKTETLNKQSKNHFDNFKYNSKHLTSLEMLKESRKCPNDIIIKQKISRIIKLNTENTESEEQLKDKSHNFVEGKINSNPKVELGNDINREVKLSSKNYIAPIKIINDGKINLNSEVELENDINREVKLSNKNYIAPIKIINYGKINLNSEVELENDTNREVKLSNKNDTAPIKIINDGKINSNPKVELGNEINREVKLSNKNYYAPIKIINDEILNNENEDYLDVSENALTNETLKKTSEFVNDMISKQELLNGKNFSKKENAKFEAKSKGKNQDFIEANLNKNIELGNCIDYEIKSKNNTINVKIINNELPRKREEQGSAPRDTNITKECLLKLKELNRENKNCFDVPLNSLTTLETLNECKKLLNDVEDKQKPSKQIILNEEKNIESEVKLKERLEDFVENNIDLNLKFEGKINLSTQSEHPETPFVIRDDMNLHPGILFHESPIQSGNPETSVQLGDVMKSHQDVQNHGVFINEINTNYTILQEEIYDQGEIQENRYPIYYGKINEKENDIPINSDSILLSGSNNNCTSQKEFQGKSKIDIEFNENHINRQDEICKLNNIKIDQGCYNNNYRSINKNRDDVRNKINSTSLIRNSIDYKTNSLKLLHKSSPHVRFKERNKYNNEMNENFIKFNDEICSENYIQRNQNYFTFKGNIDKNKNENKIIFKFLLENFGDRKNEINKIQNKSSPHVKFKEMKRLAFKVNENVILLINIIYKNNYVQENQNYCKFYSNGSKNQIERQDKLNPLLFSEWKKLLKTTDSNDICLHHGELNYLKVVNKIEISADIPLLSEPKHLKTTTADVGQNPCTNKNDQSLSVNEGFDRRWCLKRNKEIIVMKTDVRGNNTHDDEKDNISFNDCTYPVRNVNIVQKEYGHSMNSQTIIQLINYLNEYSSFRSSRTNRFIFALELKKLMQVFRNCMLYLFILHTFSIFSYIISISLYKVTLNIGV